MARSKRTPGPKHNGPPLTNEEQDALATHFALKIIADEKIAAQKKADYDAAKATVSGHFKLVSKELGITRKDFETEVIAVLGMTEAAYMAKEAKRTRLHQMAGAQPIGAQLDLVERINDTIDDTIDAEADGYRTGRRADDPVLPSHINPMFAPDWQRGWVRGQEVNAKAEAMAAEILARPSAGTVVADGDAEFEADDAEDEEELEGDDEVDGEADGEEAEDEVDGEEPPATAWAAPTPEEEKFH